MFVRLGAAYKMVIKVIYICIVFVRLKAKKDQAHPAWDGLGLVNSNGNICCTLSKAML